MSRRGRSYGVRVDSSLRLPRFRQFMHLFHISQVVFIIPRIRPGDKHVTAHRISILSRGSTFYKRARTFCHLHTRQLRHLNFSSDKVGLKSHSETNYRAKCDAFQTALTYSRLHLWVCVCDSVVFRMDEYISANGIGER